MRAKRTHKQNTKRAQLHDIKVVAARMNSKESLASMTAEAGKYYQCYDGYSESDFYRSKPIIDKSHSKRLELRTTLLRRGKPFSILPYLPFESARSHTRFDPDYDATQHKARRNYYKSGPVKQVIKNGKKVKQ